MVEVDNSEPSADLVGDCSTEVDVGQLPTAYATPASRPGATAACESDSQEFRRSLGRGARIGRFVLETELGEGGMGMVFLAEDPELQRKVALKILRPGIAGTEGKPAQQRMLREAQAMAMLSHPSLVTIYEVGLYRQSVFLAMEYVIGQTFDIWLLAKPPLEDLFEVLQQAGEALQAVHEAGLVHRDFKPANVLVTKDGRAKVLDLGIARKLESVEVNAVATQASEANPAVGEPPSRRPEGEFSVDLLSSGDAFREELTQAGAVVGTPSYMPPEQLLGAEAGPHSDQFSFAVVLFEALSGYRPHEGRSYNQLLANILAGERRPWPADCAAPVRLRGVVERALAPQSEERYPSMREFLLAFQEALGLRGQIKFLSRRWVERERHRDYLLGGGELLSEGKLLLAQHPDALSEEQQHFIKASAAASGRRRLHRRVLLGGLVLVTAGMGLTAYLLEQRSRQLEAATRAAVVSHVGAVQDGVASVLASASRKVSLIFAQRRIWLPQAERLFSVGQEDEAQLLTLVQGLNQLFRPVIEESPAVSSLMVARSDGAEYLAFDDEGALELVPKYRFYNRVVNEPAFGSDTFQVFSPHAWEGRTRSEWLRSGQMDTRGKVWTGYSPAKRVWFKNALGKKEGEIAWTHPYLFFITRDGGITASVATQRGGYHYVFALDFMLTDLSHVTLGIEDPDYWALITNSEGRIVSLPRDPRFLVQGAVREFFASVDRRRRRRAGDDGDVPAELPEPSDLGLAPLARAVESATARLDVSLSSYSWQGESYLVGRSAVGAPSQGLYAVVVEKPHGFGGD